MAEGSITEQDGLVATAKAIADLDKLLSALTRGVLPIRPWQRQLLMRLAQASREVQVLRMAIAMDREPQETAQAAVHLRATLRMAVAELEGGRADLMTRTAMQLALNLAHQVRGALAAEHKK